MSTTMLIGRRAELATLSHRAPGTWITVMGTAGIGKTRLVAEAMRDRADAGWFPTAETAGVWCVDDADRLGRDTLAELLAARDRGVAIVATAREVVGVPGEQVLALAPLATGETAEAQATALLAARCQEGGAEDLDPARLGSLGRALLGLPLALELAASRIVDRGLDAVLADLGGEIEALAASGARIVRQGVVQLATDWALANLQPDERRALQGLANRHAIDVAEPEVAQLVRRGVVRPCPDLRPAWCVPPLVRERMLAAA